MSDAPVPSRSIDRAMLDSLVSRVRVAVLPGAMPASLSGTPGTQFAQRPQEERGLFCGAGGHSERAGDPDIPDQDVALQQGAEGRRGVVQALEEHEVGLALEDAEPQL